MAQMLLNDLLGAIQAQLERLLALLEDEQQRLRERRLDGLEALLADKLDALQALERLERDRIGRLTAAGLGPDAQGMTSLLAADPAAGRTWERVLELLRLAQSRNQANGLVINGSLEQVSRQLALLQGDGGDGDPVYGPAGAARAGGGREISKA